MLFSDRWGLVARGDRGWTAARTERIANMCRGPGAPAPPTFVGSTTFPGRDWPASLLRAPHPGLKRLKLMTPEKEPLLLKRRPPSSERSHHQRPAAATPREALSALPI